MDEAPYIQWHNSLKMNGSHRGACYAPKRCLNFMDCEVFRFYRLCSTNVEPVSMIIPRKVSLNCINHKSLYRMGSKNSTL